MITASITGWKASDIPDIAVLLAFDQRSKALMVALRFGKPLPGAPHEEIARVTGAPVEIAFAACERAHKRGLIEYGASLASGVVTAKGAAYLARMMAKNTGFQRVNAA